MGFVDYDMAEFHRALDQRCDLVEERQVEAGPGHCFHAAWARREQDGVLLVRGENSVRGAGQVSLVGKEIEDQAGGIDRGPHLPDGTVDCLVATKLMQSAGSG